MNRKELMGYYEEEPKFYAKIKGWELVSIPNCIYWNYNIGTNEVFISDSYEAEGYQTQFTKEEWGELGINDTNADFEEIEVEE